MNCSDFLLIIMFCGVQIYFVSMELLLYGLFVKSMVCKLGNVDWALLVASEATTASEVKFDLRFEICGPNHICNHVCFGCLGFLWKYIYHKGSETT